MRDFTKNPGAIENPGRLNGSIKKKGLVNLMDVMNLGLGENIDFKPSISNEIVADIGWGPKFKGKKVLKVTTLRFQDNELIESHYFFSNKEGGLICEKGDCYRGAEATWKKDGRGNTYWSYLEMYSNKLSLN